MRAKFGNHSFAASAVILLFLINCHAQKDVTSKIDNYIKAEMQSQRIPGLSLAVIKNGQIILAKGYGFANVEHQVSVKPETVFQSGSIGKQFVATAVMMLVEEGKLSLDDKISKYFTDTPENWKDITLRHLLSHTSGMGDYPNDYDLRRDYTEDELVKIIKAQPLGFKPGEKWSYSNLGFITLGILIHKITGKFYGDFLAERIFKPLGMNTARIISEEDIVQNRAAGYRLVSRELKNQEWVAPLVNTTADGSLYLTILDMAKWDAALDTEKLLKKSSLDQMWMPPALSGGKTSNYGFGWFAGKFHGHRIVYHGGTWQGFKSFIVRFLDDKLTIVFFANLLQTNESKLMRGLASVFYPEFALPDVQPIEEKESDVKTLARKVLLQLMDNKLDKNLFTSEMQASFPPDRARQMSENLNSLSLPIAIIYSTTELIERKEENNFRTYRYILTDLGATWFFTLKLTKDNKIAGIELQPK